jgi:hypothetical protein
MRFSVLRIAKNTANGAEAHGGKQGPREIQILLIDIGVAQNTICCAKSRSLPMRPANLQRIQRGIPHEKFKIVEK